MSRNRPLQDTAIRYSVTINYRFGAILLALAFATIVGAYFHRSYWLERNYSQLMEYAQHLYENDDRNSAIFLGLRYIAVHPDDGDAMMRVADWVEEKGSTPKNSFDVFQAMSDHIARHPNRNDIRRKLVRLGFEMGQHAVLAETHLPVLQPELCDDPELLDLFIQSFLAVQKGSKAIELYLDCIERRPAIARHYENLIDWVSQNDVPSRDLRTLKKAFHQYFETSEDETTDQSHVIDPNSIRTALLDENSGLSDELDMAMLDPEEILLGGPPPSRNKVIDAILAAVAQCVKPASDGHLLRLRQYVARSQFELADREITAIGDSLLNDEQLVLLRMELALKRRDNANLFDESEMAVRFQNDALEIGKNSMNSPAGGWRVALMMGRIALESQDTRAAENYLRSAVELGDVAINQYLDSPSNRLKRLDIFFRTHWGLINCLILRAYEDNPEGDREYLDEIEKMTNEFRQSKIQSWVLQFLEGRIKLVNRQWRDAAEILERVRGMATGSTESRRNVDSALIQCYANLQNPDMKIRVYQRALNDDPSWTNARIGLALSFAEIGRDDQALAEFSRLQLVTSIPLSVLRLEIRKQLRQRREKRDWASIESVLTNLANSGQNTPEVIGLRVEVMFQKQEYDRAEELLNTARANSPNNFELASMAVEFHLSRPDRTIDQRVQAAEAIVDSIGDIAPVDQLLLRGEITVLKYAGQSGEYLEKLSQDGSDLPQSGRVRLLIGLAAKANGLGLATLAHGFLSEAVSLDSTSIELQMQLAVLSVQTGDDDTYQECLDQLESNETTDRPNYHFVAALGAIRDYQRLVESRDLAIRERRGLLLQSAQAHLSMAVKSRSSWALAHKHLATVYAELGDEQSAYNEFRTAMKCGDRSRETQLNIIRHLQRNQRDTEIVEVIEQIEDYSPLLVDDEVARAGVLAAFRSRRWDEALRRTDQLNSTTLTEKMIRAQLLLARNDNPEEVETLLRESIELGPNQPFTWYFLVVFLTREQRLPEAQKVLERISTEVPEQPEYLRHSIRANCLEYLGETDAAQNEFQLTHNDSLQNLALINEHINFCVRQSRFSEAQRLLRLIIESGSALDPETRTKAQLLYGQLRVVSATNAAEIEDALASLGSKDDIKTLSSEMIRAQADLYSRSSMRRDQLRLIRVLEELGRRSVLRPNEALQLAFVYDLNGRWPDAWAIYRKLIQEDPTSGASLAGFLMAGTRRKNPDARLLGELEQALTLLQKADGDSFRTIVAQTRVMVLKKQHSGAATVLTDFIDRINRGQPVDLFRELIRVDRQQATVTMLSAAMESANDKAALHDLGRLLRGSNLENDAEIIVSIRKYVEKEEVSMLIREEFTKMIAGIAETLGMLEEAESIIRDQRKKFRTIDGDVTLISFLARRDRHREALDLAESLVGKVPVTVLARIQVATLRASGSAPMEPMDRVEKDLKKYLAAAENESDQVVSELSSALADLYDFQQRFTEARGVYQRLLQRNENNVLALNNLAWILSFDADPIVRERGLAMINKAISIVGPIADLLDTRAMVQLNLSRNQEAVNDMTLALEEMATPIMWLHLSFAQFRAKDVRGAAESIERAMSSELSPESMHPLERSLYEEVRQGIIGAGKSRG